MSTITKIKKISLVAVLAFALVLGVGAGAAQATLTFDANSIATNGAFTVTSVAATAANLFAANTTGNINIGGTSQTSGVTTIYGGTGAGAITLTPGTAGTIQIGSGTSGAVTITPATIITGITTHGSNVVSDTDSTDSLGTTGVRWASIFSDGFTGNTIALDGATGVNTLTITDAAADALSIVRGSTDVMVFNTATPLHTR